SHREAHMYTKAGLIGSRALLVAAATVSTFFVGNLSAHDRTRLESIIVSPRGLDLARPADAQAFYTRLQNAAWVVCTRRIHVDLVLVEKPKACVERALGDAIRSAKVPLLTQIYLRSHTLEEAAAHGIGVPSQVAAK